MLTIKRSVTQHFWPTRIARYKHSFAWHVMHTHCAQQRSVELSRIRLFLHGGERINRMALLYTPFSPINSRIRSTLKYALPTGMHISLEELRSTGELQSGVSGTDNNIFPQDLHAKQTFGALCRGGWESSIWLSRPQLARNRAMLLQMANNLLMRRGMQADLGQSFVRALNYMQDYRLQSRLENFHPQGSKLLELQRHFIRRYSNLFSMEQSLYGLPVLRERALPGLHEIRRTRRRRSKLRGVLTSRGLFEMRPRLGTGIYAENAFVLSRPHQLPFMNMLALLSRQILRSVWRRRRGLGLLRRSLRKTGRLVWNLPMCNYMWPLRQPLTPSVELSGHSLYSTSGVYTIPCISTNIKKSSVTNERLVRAFPFLFQ